MKAKMFLSTLVAVLVLSGCSGGGRVSQEEYDAIKSERDELAAELEQKKEDYFDAVGSASDLMHQLKDELSVYQDKEQQINVQQTYISACMKVLDPDIIYDLAPLNEALTDWSLVVHTKKTEYDIREILSDSSIFTDGLGSLINDDCMIQSLYVTYLDKTDVPLILISFNRTGDTFKSTSYCTNITYADLMNYLVTEGGN